MPILNRDDNEKVELSPGVDRWALVDGEKGSEATSVGDVVVGVDGVVPTHIHPTEEAMVMLEGEMDAILGDEVITGPRGADSVSATGSFVTALLTGRGRRRVCLPSSQRRTWSALWLTDRPTKDTATFQQSRKQNAGNCQASRRGRRKCDGTVGAVRK